MATALGCDGHDEQEAKEFPTCEQAIAETLQHQTASEQSCGAAHPNCTCSEGEGGTGTLEVYCPDVERRCMGSVCGTQDPRGYYDRDAQNHTLASFNYMWAYDGSVREEMLVYALFPNSTCLFGIAENLYSENLTMMCTCQWVPSCGSKNNTHGFISVDCSNYESGAVADQCNETNFGIKPGSVLDGLAVAWNDGCEKTANANTKPPIPLGSAGGMGFSGQDCLPFPTREIRLHSHRNTSGHEQSQQVPFYQANKTNPNGGWLVGWLVACLLEVAHYRQDR